MNNNKPMVEHLVSKHLTSKHIDVTKEKNIRCGKGCCVLNKPVFFSEMLEYSKPEILTTLRFMPLIVFHPDYPEGLHRLDSDEFNRDLRRLESHNKKVLVSEVKPGFEIEVEKKPIPPLTFMRALKLRLLEFSTRFTDGRRPA